MPITMYGRYAIATVPAANSTNRMASVEYATDESASEEKTASAVFLFKRSCIASSVLIGLPTKKRFSDLYIQKSPVGQAFLPVLCFATDQTHRNVCLTFQRAKNEKDAEHSLRVF